MIYNPKKGKAFTKKIIKSLPDVRFVPLVGMRRKEMIEMMTKAKVYIDFGNHPGKDRIPREAAVSGCCVITGKKGSAGNSDDVPISEEYKFNQHIFNVPKIKKIIRECLDSYPEKSKDFSDYIGRIQGEKAEFINQVMDFAEYICNSACN